MRSLPLVLVALTVLTGCMSAKEKAYLGSWQDSGEGAVYTFEKVGNNARMTTIVDTDGERFEVIDSGMTGGVMMWHYRVPSTEYRVQGIATELVGDTINYDWSNEAPDGEQASGTDSMTRVK